MSNRLSPRRRIATIAVAATVAGAVACLAAALFLAESALHVPSQLRKAERHPDSQIVTITGLDGIKLRGAMFRPQSDQAPRGAVLLMHGVTDRGYSMSGLAKLLTQRGFLALAADGRGHGGSGGEQITYGLLEREDVVCWLDWISRETNGQTRIYGYGASLGGAVLLESLEVCQRFSAVIAECPFDEFRNVAYDRLLGLMPASPVRAPRFALWPIVEPALAYTRLRYGLDLRQASPINGLRASQTPVLLIHGTADRNIPVIHSRRLLEARPRLTELWEVPGAGHVDAWRSAGTEFEKRVTSFLETH